MDRISGAMSLKGRRMTVRRLLGEKARALARQYPVVTITGPRQSGKTTLARDIFADMPYANLERPDVRAFAIEDPLGFLAQFPNGAVLDEIQRTPELFSYIQVQVDEAQRNGLFVLTGSQQFNMLDRISQSLAGRTALLTLLPFSIDELRGNYGMPSLDALMVNGFYPRIYEEKLDPSIALGAYFETYVQRDVRQLLRVRDLSLFERFVRLCAGRVGQLFKLSSIADDTGISHSTAREWVSILEAGFVLFQLKPFHKNIGKRLVKSPKLYFYDVGLATYLCGIESPGQMSVHPLRGSFFENLIVVEALKYRFNDARRPNLMFYRDSNGNEVDLLYQGPRGLLPIEVKSGRTISKSQFRGLSHFAKVESPLPYGACLVYGGDTKQSRSTVTVTTAFEFVSTLDKLLSDEH